MYLLILMFIDVIHILINYLHPTMYLLIRTYFLSVFPCLLYLHPTMYLLIQGLRKWYKLYKLIYIPLCIY